MARFNQYILEHKKSVVIVSILLAIINLVLFFAVKVNYNMVDYLPQEAPSTKALYVMQQEFKDPLPNLKVMLKNVSIEEALSYKEKIKNIEHVQSILWLDDIVDVTRPLSAQDQTLINSYYKDNCALFSIAIDSENAVVTTDKIDALIGPNNAIAGEIMDSATMQKMSVSESLNAIIILLPLILIILFLCTSSYIEPLLYLSAIGIAVLINMGTNALFKDISFITQSVSPILQLAVSLDYSIILLKYFSEFKKTEKTPLEAMKKALSRALTSISASAATTLLGFAALLFMRFQIGSDLGLNLVKGILLSFLSVMIFLPCFTLMLLPLLDKTKHKQFFKGKNKAGKNIFSLRIPCLVLVLLIIIPSFLAAQKNEYIYGNGKSAPLSRGGKSNTDIEEVFSTTSTQVLLVEKGNPVKEETLCNALSKLQNVAQVTSYVTMVDSKIPVDFLDPNIVSQFYSPNYARILITCTAQTEGKEAFKLVQEIRNTTNEYYKTYYLLGESVNLYDMKTTIESDTSVINLIAIGAIFLVLLIALKSPLLPVLLIFTIQSAIYINLAFQYFEGKPLNYIGYLVISTVQLGATVDYAIMLTDAYREERKKLAKIPAIQSALNSQFSSILISSSILSAAGFCLMLTSTNPIVSELGLLLGRGTVLSASLVLFVLPALLLLFDKINNALTFKKKENKPL